MSGTLPTCPVTRLPYTAEEVRRRLPRELLDCPQWVCWQSEIRDGKWTKVLKNPHTRGNALSNTRGTWGTFDQAMRTFEHRPELHGIGFVFSPDDQFAGLDLDHCIGAEGMAPWAQAILDRLPGYAEVSPSGTGVKVFFRTARPLNHNGKRPNYPAPGCAVEMYGRERFFTVTGEGLGTVDMPDCTEQAAALNSELWPPKERAQRSTPYIPELPMGDDDAALLERARSARNGHRFSLLWEGRWEDAGCGSHSEADLALSSGIAFWTGPDPARVDRMFRQSGLMRDKWLRDDYREKTLTQAINRSDFYTPPRNGNGAHPHHEEIPPPNDCDCPWGDRPASPAPTPPPVDVAEMVKEALAQVRAGDPSPVFADQFLDTAVRMKAKDRPAFQALKDVLRKASIPMRDWEEALRDRSRGSNGKVHREQPLVTAAPVIIVTNRFLQDMTEETLAAMEAANRRSPQVFASGGVLARIQVDEAGPGIQYLTESALRGIMARAALFMKTGEGSDQPTSPPMDAVKDILALPSYPFPVLEGVTRCPVVAPDGSIIMTPGYHRGTRLYYHADPRLRLPQVSPRPTASEVARSKRLLLEETYGDFPFRDEASKAHTIALTILPVVRPLIDGPTPLHHADGSQAGVGKGKLVDTAAVITSGIQPSKLSPGRDDDEWRKRITSALIPSPASINVDNIRSRLDSAPLAAALTSMFWEDRYLGTSRNVKIPVRCAWTSTGNNTTFSEEIARRVCYMRLSYPGEHPEERTGFRHDNLLGWALEHRGELLWAVLTIVQAWLAAGRPAGKRTLGSYESWAQVIGGILDTSGIPGFLGNHRELVAHANEDVSLWKAFVAEWWGNYQEREVGTNILFDLAVSKELLSPILGDGNDTSQRTRLGKAIGVQRDRVFGAWRIVRCEKTDKSGRQQYHLVVADVVPGIVNVCPTYAATSATPEQPREPLPGQSADVGIRFADPAPHDASPQNIVIPAHALKTPGTYATSADLSQPLTGSQAQAAYVTAYVSADVTTRMPSQEEVVFE